MNLIYKSIDWTGINIDWTGGEESWNKRASHKYVYNPEGAFAVINIVIILRPSTIY